MNQTATGQRPNHGPGPTLLKIAALLAAVLAVAVTIAVALAERRHAIEGARSEGRHAARLIAAEVKGLLTTIDAVLHQAVRLSGPPDQPVSASREAWEELVALADTAPYIQSLWFGGPDGAALLATHQFPAPALSASDRDYFIAQRDGNPGLFMGVVRRDRYTAERSLVLSRRLERADGSFRGFVSATVSPEPFRAALAKADGMPATLMRSDGTELLATEASRKAEVATADEDFAAAATAASSGVYEDEDGPDGVRLVVFRRVEPMAVFVRVDVQLKPITNAWARNHLAAYVLIGVAAVLSVLSWSWLALSRTRKAENTVEALERVRHGLEERIAAHTDSLRRANQRLAEAVADKEVLYREVHHRVKNNLQVVTSLLQLQSARLSPEARRPFEDSLARISAMSLVHEMLYRSDQPSRIDFSRYLGAVGEAIIARREARARISVELVVEPILMDLDRAVPLALLVNELIGATLDHAYGEDGEGVLRLHLRRQSGGAQLAILPDGPDAAQMPAGFGLLLVDALAAQIGAGVTYDREGRGGFQVWMPLPAAADERSRAAC